MFSILKDDGIRYRIAIQGNLKRNKPRFVSRRKASENSILNEDTLDGDAVKDNTVFAALVHVATKSSVVARVHGVHVHLIVVSMVDVILTRVGCQKPRTCNEDFDTSFGIRPVG